MMRLPHPKGQRELVTEAKYLDLLPSPFTGTDNGDVEVGSMPCYLGANDLTT